MTKDKKARPKFPADINQYNELVAHLDLAYPERWGVTVDCLESHAAHLVILSKIWIYIEDASKSSFSRENIARERQWAAGHPGRQLSRHVPVVERILEKGVPPEDIAELVQIKQEEIAASICYCINEPGGIVDDSSEFYAGVYMEDKNFKPKEPITGLDELFWDARPRSYAEFTDSV